jgi:hypothetical protein
MSCSAIKCLCPTADCLCRGSLFTYWRKRGEARGEVLHGQGRAEDPATLGLISESDNHTSVSTAKAIAVMSKSYGGSMPWDLAEDATGSSSVYEATRDSL